MVIRSNNEPRVGSPNKVPSPQPPSMFTARTVHFYDDGASLLVTYLESHQVYVLLLLFHMLLDTSLESVIRSNHGL